MPIYARHFVRGELQFITTSTYRRARLFTCQRFRWIFVEVLRQLRQETGFLLNGWVLMPDHFHLLIRPEPPEATVRFMQELKKRTARDRGTGDRRDVIWVILSMRPYSVLLTHHYH